MYRSFLFDVFVRRAPFTHQVFYTVFGFSFRVLILNAKLVFIRRCTWDVHVLRGVMPQLLCSTVVLRSHETYCGGCEVFWLRVLKRSEFPVEKHLGMFCDPGLGIRETSHHYNHRGLILGHHQQNNLITSNQRMNAVSSLLINFRYILRDPSLLLSAVLR